MGLLPGISHAPYSREPTLTALVAGTASGLLMASIFVSVGVIMLFPLVKDPSPQFHALIRKTPPSTIVIGITVISYPMWAIIGAISGILYNISVEQIPGSGLGSPNLTFTIAVMVIGLMMAAPFAVVLRRVIAGVVGLTLAFIGVFGWFLPYFAE